jgi:WD40 repeat protein
MNNYMELVSGLLGQSAEYLDDSSIEVLLEAVSDILSPEQLASFFETRCFADGYAVRVESKAPQRDHIRMNFGVLYRMNRSCCQGADPNLCYVQISDILISIPVTHVSIADMVGHIYSSVRTVVEKQFILNHMAADGSAGLECVPGQSGSRFVARTFAEGEMSDPSPISPRSKALSKRLRRSSLQHSRILCLRCASNPGPATLRGRQSLRENSEVSTYRHYLYRSHSEERPRCVRTHTGDHCRSKIFNLFFSSAGATGTDEASTSGSTAQSRWSLPGMPAGQNTIPTSSIYNFYPPIDFDINRIRIPVSPAIQSPSGLTDSSPQSTPFARDLTPVFHDVATGGRANNLLSVIQDLISRRVLTEGVSVEVPVERAVRSMSAQFDTLFGMGNQHRQREELRRMYAPLNAHVVSRTVAVGELSKIMPETAVAELLRIAEQQGVKERPLLVQLNRGQWHRLCPRDFRVCAQMIGPTNLFSPTDLLPLPEHKAGSLALERLDREFSKKCLSNTVWHIRIRLEPFTYPCVLGGGSIRDWNGELSSDDCRAGFRKLENGSGVLVTKWEGIVDVGEHLFPIERTATVESLLTRFKNSVKLKHGLDWDSLLHVDFASKPSDNTNLLRNNLHWSASEYLQLSLRKDGKFVLKRVFDEPFSDTCEGDLGTETGVKTIANASTDISNGVSSSMLWDVVTQWASNDTRNVLSQYASRDQDASEALPPSPVMRRRRLMAKAAQGGPVNRQEVEELGVDVNTEYARWWLDHEEEEQEENESHRERSPRKKERVHLSLPPPTVAVDLESPTSTSRPSSPPPISIKRPLSPVSPISRSRRQSALTREEEPSTILEPRVLRATRDTRQFEFHPFDPNLILTGSRSGVISLVDADKDMVLMQTRVDSSPILGLSWLRAHMNVALYGASSSGLVGILKLGHTDIEYQPIGRFQNLSSVSINCTDDYFIVSGFSRDVSLFDLVSGRKVSEFKEIHSNFINITRFANFSPHLLATSSFDSSCKLWDLRRPPSSPVATYTTPSLNVMCCFSPLDENLLVSGLDANLVQLSVKKGLKPNLSPEVVQASVPPRNSSSNYRRAVYTADGSCIITSGTDENFMRVINATTGAGQGLCRFDGLLETFEEALKLKQPGYKAIKQDSGAPHAHGEVANGKSAEYVQSLRGHPIFSKEVGVLLYPFDRSRSSFICTTQIPHTAN